MFGAVQELCAILPCE